MKIVSPLKVYKFFRGPKIAFHIGLSRKWAMKIAHRYMFSKFYKEHIRIRNIEAGLKWEQEKGEK